MTDGLTPTTTDLAAKIDRGHTWQRVIVIVAATIMLVSGVTSTAISIVIAARLLDRQDQLTQTVDDQVKQLGKNNDAIHRAQDQNAKQLEEIRGLRDEIVAAGLIPHTPSSEGNPSGSSNRSNPSGGGGSTTPGTTPTTGPPGTTTTTQPPNEPPHHNPQPQPQPPPEQPGPLSPVCGLTTQLGLTVCN